MFRSIGKGLQSGTTARAWLSVGLLWLGIFAAGLMSADDALAQTSAIGGQVWLDRDADGSVNAEPGLVGVTVELYDELDSLLADTVTAPDGGYVFSGLAAGNYIVRVDAMTLPADVYPTYESDGVVDSEILTDVAEGATELAVDWGFQGSGSVSGLVFDDINADGLVDGGEAGLGGAVLTLTNAAYGFSFTTTSAGDGGYYLGGFPALSYTLSIDPSSLPGYNAVSEPDAVVDGQMTVDLAGVTYVTGLHFGFNGNGVIEGRIFLDFEPINNIDSFDMGLVGVSIALFDDQDVQLDTADTVANGDYRFDNLAPGTYKVWVLSNTLPFGLLHTYDPNGFLDRQETVTVSSGEVIGEIDFGFAGNIDVNSVVIFDVNGDGMFDNEDSGLSGVTVILTDLQSLETSQLTTGANGGYLYDGLYPGSFRISVDPSTIPAGLSPVWDRDGTADHQTELTTEYDVDISDANFSYNGSGMISGTVVSDANGNGVKDVGEGGLQNVQLNLMDEFFVPLLNTTTAADGTYQFTGLNAGTYYVLVDVASLPSGATATFDPEGPLDDIGRVVLSFGEQFTDVDFGYEANGSVFGGIFQDANGDGAPDGNETSILGVTVDLYDDQGTFLNSTAVDDYGNYEFAQLEPGNYSVQVDTSTLPTGYVPTYDYDGVVTPHVADFTVVSGEVAYGINFGYTGPGSISGRVFTDLDGDGFFTEFIDNGLFAVRVLLLDDQSSQVGEQTSDDFGLFYFDGLAAGDYTVQIDETTLPPNYTAVLDNDGSSSPHVTTATVASGQSTDTIFFAYEGPGEAYGSVFNDADLDSAPSPGDIGLQGVRVILQDDQGQTQDEALTDEYGSWYFSDLLPGDYLVYLDESTLPPNFTQVWDYDGLETPHAASLNVEAGKSAGDITFGYQGPGEVYGGVFNDADLDGAPSPGDIGLQGIRVILQDDQGQTQDEVLTDEYGGWYFSDLLPGDYLVYLDESTLPPNFTQVWDYDGLETPHAASFNVQAGQATGDISFGYQGPGEVYGGVFNDADLDGAPSPGDIGLQGIRVILQDDQGQTQDEVLTDEYGGWYFSDLLPGDYLVYLDESTLPPNFTQVWDYDGLETPHAASFNVQAGQATGDISFGYQGPGEVYGGVFNDADLDGAPSPGDIGLQGIRVILQDDQGQTQDEVLTDEYGGWYFSDLLPGDYLVYLDESTLPPNFTQVWDYDGLETPHAASFNVQAGQATGDISFGYQGPGEVYGGVLNDTDLDGAPSFDDVGLQGVRVILQDAQGTTLDEMLTESSGFWYFSDLLPGDYLVYLDTSTLPPNFTQVWDYDGLETPHAASFNVQAGQSAGNISFGYQGPGEVYGGVLNDADLDGAPSFDDVGLQGVRVILQDAQGTTQGEMLTEASGFWYFSDLLPGDYSVYLDTSTLPPNFTQVWDYDGLETPHAASFNVQAGQSSGDISFGYQGPGEVNGGVLHDVDLNGTQSIDDRGLQGIRVILQDAQGATLGEMLTEASGLWYFSDLLPGDYLVYLDTSTLPPNFTQVWDYDGLETPHAASFNVQAGQSTGFVTFGYQGPGEVNGGVLHDVDLNGTQSIDDRGLQGIRVILQDAQGTTLGEMLTEASGLWYFSDLLPGDYLVYLDTSTLPPNFTQVWDYDGLETPHAASFNVQAGQSTGLVSFGYQGPGEAYGGVFHDADLDGVPSVGDVGVQGIRVVLEDDQGMVQGETVTGESGSWFFPDLPPGDYLVYVDTSTLPPNSTQVWDYDGLETPHAASFNVQAGERTGVVSFGYRGPGEVHGSVFLDADLNGAPSPGDIGLQGIRMILQDDQGMIQEERLTDENGAWLFIGLVPGDYLVYVDTSTLPPNFNPVWDYDGLGTPHAASFNVEAGLATEDVSFGYQGPGEVYGGVFLDADLDGAPSLGDTGLQGIRVIVQNDQGQTQGDVLTDANGVWYFGDLPPGDYLAYVDTSTLPPNFTQVWDGDGLGTPHAASFNVQPGLATEDVSFGYQGPGEVYGGVFHDADLDGGPSGGDIGLQGIRVILEDDQGMTQGEVLTDANGAWYFGDLLPGDYLAYVDTSTLPPNFTQVWDSDSLSTPHAVSFNVQAGLAAGDITFGYQGPGEVYGGVFNDADLTGSLSPGDIGLQGIRVVLEDGQGMTQGEVLTDANGAWYFGDLLPGDYLAYVDTSTLPPNFTQVWDHDGSITPHAVSFSVQAGLAAGDITFGYVGPGSIDGLVLQDADLDDIPSDADTAMENVRVQLLNDQGAVVAEMLTDSLGKFHFEGLLGGSYTVVVDPSTLPPAFTLGYDSDGTVTAHQVATSVIAGAPTYGLIFGYTGPASLTGGVYDDLNGNSVLDAGEPGWRGVRLQLLDDQGTQLQETFTDGFGAFAFMTLLPGDYVVQVDMSTLPSDYEPTFDPDLTMTPNEAALTLGAGVANGGFNFGYAQSGDPDLLAHWTLDESAGGLAVDVTGNGYDGLWSGSPLPVAGLFANGLSFDGQDDVVEVPASAALDSLSAITMSAWVQLDATGNWLGIVDKRDGGTDGFDLYVNPSANAFMRINDSVLNGTTVLTAGTWHHLVATYDGSNMVLYVDGVEDASQTAAASGLDTNGPLLLGENYARGNSYFDGVLDDVRIYSRSLDAAEVAELTQEAGTVTDTVAPTLGNAAPFGTLAVGTTQVDLTLTTGEDATCRYSQSAGVTYDSMGDVFSGAAGMSHSAALSGLNAGSHSYFVRCEDVAGNQNTADFEITFSIASPGDLSSGLVGHWAFEEGSGTLAADGSGLSSDGTLVGGPTWTGGQSGQGLAFDGADDAISFAAAPALDSMAQVTMSAWIQHSASGSWRSIIDKRDVGNDGYDLYITSGSRLFMRINDQTLTGNTVVADGSWHHVVGVYDGHQMVLYVDGVPDGSRTVGATSLNTWRTLRLGENWETGNSYFGGSLDEVRIYDRALTASEVTELHQTDF